MTQVGRLLDTPFEFKWQTQDGLRLTPAEMKTSHLFNTVCLLWHHTMPADAILHPHRRWNLSSRFTEEFTRSAIRVLLIELMTRDCAQYRPTLEKMFLYLNRNQASLHRGPLRIVNHHETRTPPSLPRPDGGLWPR